MDIRYFANVKGAATPFINYKLYTKQDEIIELCEREDVSNLHENGQLKWALENPKGWKVKALSIAFHGERAIGLVAKVIGNKYNVQAYVEPDYRRMGIGTKLVQSITRTFTKDDPKIHTYRGEEVPKLFFTKVLEKVDEES